MGIVDDEVALEGEETFQFFIFTVPEGVEAGEENEAVVTILDDDDGNGYVNFFLEKLFDLISFSSY